MSQRERRFRRGGLVEMACCRVRIAPPNHSVMASTHRRGGAPARSSLNDAPCKDRATSPLKRDRHADAVEALRLDTLRAAHGARAAADGWPLTFARLPLPPQPSPFATASTAGADGGTRAVAPPRNRMAVTLIRSGDDP